MTKPLTPDICFIGGSSSIAEAIAAASAMGLSVVAVETGSSDRTRAALLRSLALGAAAREAALARAAAPGGDAAAEPDFKRLARHFEELGKPVAAASEGRFTAVGARLIKGEARFKDARTLVVGNVELRARRFVLATGSVPVIPPIAGLEAVECLTEDTVFALTRRPGHLLVIGSGPATVELAQAYRRLGSEVTIVASAPLLADHDHEMAAVILRRLAAEGVTIHEKATVNEVQRKGKGVRLQLLTDGGMSAVDGTHVLAADHRVPNVAALDLHKAGVASGEKGVSISATLRTGNRRIFAIGEVTGERHFAHVVEHQAGLMVRAALTGKDEPGDAALVPRLVMTDPPLAEVGLSLADPAKLPRGTKILRWPYAQNDRAVAEGRTFGHIKLAAAADGRISGVSIAGTDAVEMIALWSLVLSKNLGVADVAGLALPASTFGEIGKRAAISYFPLQRKPSFGRKLAGLLRVFG